MHDTAENILTRHALAGTQTITGHYHDTRGGSCAVGLLHADIPGHEAIMLCRGCSGLIGHSVAAYYGLTRDVQLGQIIRANDDGVDLLTIARKYATLDADGAA